MKKFWNWKSRKAYDQITGEESVERILTLNGTIAEQSWYDDDVTPQMFRDELNAGEGNITVWINSPGGDCVAAAQIYNMLQSYYGQVTVKIDGIAASAASVIAMAGDTVMMSPVSMLMIHNPATLAFGDHTEIEEITIPESVETIYSNAFGNANQLRKVTFERTDGWVLAASYNATSGDAIDLSDPAQNAVYLNATYKTKYFRRLS